MTKMKAQKLGLVLGMNMAVACLVFQGCKVTQPGAANMPPPRVDPAISAGEAPSATVSTATVEPAVETTVVATPAETSVSAIEVTSTTEPAVDVQQPSQVATVKPLPAAKSRPAVAAGAASASAPVVESAADAVSSVVVQRGDTLSAICARNHVKMSAVVAANPGLNPNRIRVGQKIALPGGAVAAAADPAAKSAKVMNASAPAPVAANTTAPIKKKSSFASYEGPTKEYKVRSGDMLGKIAYSSGITVRALKEMNKLSGDNLKVGQTLLIPAEKVVAAKPAAAKVAGKDVKKDDKAAAVDVKKGGAVSGKPVAEVPSPVTVAEPVQVPAAEPTAPAAASAAPATVVDAAAKTQAPVDAAVVSDVAAAAPVDATPASSLTYTVKEGDDIVGVAIAWGISPSQLMDLNNLKAGEAINPGQVLKLPANAKQSAQ